MSKYRWLANSLTGRVRFYEKSVTLIKSESSCRLFKFKRRYFVSGLDADFACPTLADAEAEFRRAVKWATGANL